MDWNLAKLTQTTRPNLELTGSFPAHAGQRLIVNVLPFGARARHKAATAFGPFRSKSLASNSQGLSAAAS